MLPYVVHDYLCQFDFYLFINIDKMDMKRNMFLVNLPFHIMEVRREKAMITYSKGCHETFFIHSSIPSFIHGWHHTRNKTLA
jgi:hypothetical protein